MLVAREKEVELLRSALEDESPQFIAVYGRRAVFLGPPRAGQEPRPEHRCGILRVGRPFETRLYNMGNRRSLVACQG